MKTLTITNTDTGMTFISNATQFAFDGCHKIYLLHDGETRTDVERIWPGTNNIYPIEKLEETYRNSCPLTFISTWQLQPVIEQFEDESAITFQIED